MSLIQKLPQARSSSSPASAVRPSETAASAKADTDPQQAQDHLNADLEAQNDHSSPPTTIAFTAPSSTDRKHHHQIPRSTTTTTRAESLSAAALLLACLGLVALLISFAMQARYFQHQRSLYLAVFEGCSNGTVFRDRKREEWPWMCSTEAEGRGWHCEREEEESWVERSCAGLEVTEMGGKEWCCGVGFGVKMGGEGWERERERIKGVQLRWIEENDVFEKCAIP
ncbi:hypothetical protein LTS18_007828 [Coniosporium uncinatum]|uniref:Uncharacterized protein n=1 Tax=Coniosporium uncinatum TaxID=93489 RepID=A0ACC3E088_9PEZI|nr:hypothetical protein LTS18_007828 [Coniosporium uncinatum]